jgi:AcrR family transcriptional regulator
VSTRLLPRPQRHASILRAAATAFAHAGYAATSMDDIATAAGVTKLIVYRHFESKEHLYRAVLEQVATRLAEEFTTGVEEGRKPGFTARAFIMVARENPDGFRLLWRHSAREPQFAEYTDQFRRGAITAALTLVAPRIDDATLHTWAAETIVDYLVDSTLNWLDDGAADRDAQFVEMTTRGLMAVVRAWGA